MYGKLHASYVRKNIAPIFRSVILLRNWLSNKLVSIKIVWNWCWLWSRYNKSYLTRFYTLGLKVVYNLTRTPGNRVLSVDARCLECDYPSYSPLQDDQEYKIFIVPFLAQGGGGFTWKPIQQEDFSKFLFK